MTDHRSFAWSRNSCLASRLGYLFQVVAAGDLVTAWVVTLSYIINLAIKAFTFSKNIATFKAIIDAISDTTP